MILSIGILVFTGIALAFFRHLVVAWQFGWSPFRGGSLRNAPKLWRRKVRPIRRSFQKTLACCGLGETVTTAKGKKAIYLPVIRKAQYTKSEVVLYLRPNRKQTLAISDIVRAQPLLESKLGVPVTIEPDKNDVSTAIIRLMMCRLFEKTILLRDHMGEALSSSPEDIPKLSLGFQEDGDEVLYSLLLPAHWAISGITRSGKSVFTYTLLALLAWLSNLHVRVTGIDPTGLTLKPFLERYGDTLIACEPQLSATQIMRVLDSLVSQMHERLNMLKNLDRDNLQISRQTPLIFAVFEEFPTTLAILQRYDTINGLKGTDRLTPRGYGYIQELLQGAAKVRINVCLIAQRFSSSQMSTDWRDLLDCRVSFKTNHHESVAMLFPNLGSETKARFENLKPGVGYCQLPDGQQGFFKSYLTTYHDYLDIARSQLGVSHKPALPRVASAEQRQRPTISLLGATTTAPYGDGR